MQHLCRTHAGAYGVASTGTADDRPGQRVARLHFYACLGNTAMIRQNARNTLNDRNITSEAKRLASEIESLSYQLEFELRTNIPTEWK